MHLIEKYHDLLAEHKLELKDKNFRVRSYSNLTSRQKPTTTAGTTKTQFFYNKQQKSMDMGTNHLKIDNKQNLEVGHIQLKSSQSQRNLLFNQKGLFQTQTQYLFRKHSSIMENECNKAPNEIIHQNDFEGLKCKLFDGKLIKNSLRGSYQQNRHQLHRGGHTLYNQVKVNEQDKDIIHKINQDQININKRLFIVQRQIDDTKYINEKIMNYNEDKLNKIKEYEQKIISLKSDNQILHQQNTQEYQQAIKNKKKNKFMKQKHHFKSKQLETLENKLMVLEYDRHIYSTKLNQKKHNKN